MLAPRRARCASRACGRSGVAGTLRLRMRRELAAVALIAAAAFAVRLYPAWHGVFGGPDANFLETDAWYHVRLVENQVRNFPWRVTLDPYAAPGGQFVPIAPLYDTMTSTAVVAAPRPRCRSPAVERVAAFLPPIFGTLAVVVVWALARRVFGCRAAFLSAAHAGGAARAFHGSHDARLRRSPRARGAAGAGDAAGDRRRPSGRTRRADAGSASAHGRVTSPPALARALPAGLGAAARFWSRSSPAWLVLVVLLERDRRAIAARQRASPAVASLVALVLVVALPGSTRCIASAARW